MALCESYTNQQLILHLWLCSLFMLDIMLAANKPDYYGDGYKNTKYNDYGRDGEKPMYGIKLTPAMM